MSPFRFRIFAWQSLEHTKINPPVHENDIFDIGYSPSFPKSFVWIGIGFRVNELKSNIFNVPSYDEVANKLHEWSMSNDVNDLFIVCGIHTQCDKGRFFLILGEIWFLLRLWNW